MAVALFISEKLEGLRLYSASVFRIFSLSFLALGFNIVGSGYFTAIERPKESLVISMGRGMIIMAAVLAGCIAVMGGGGIWWAPAVSELLCLVVTLFLVYLYESRALYRTSRIQIPTPEFFVFYNGDKRFPKRENSETFGCIP